MIKQTTLSDHRERLNKVLIHIQENIEQPLLLDTLASVASFSPFHFHRIFSSHVGESLSSYIRRVRLDKAANRICQDNFPITEAALSAGYETPAAFTKAFRTRFGTNPTEFKKRKGRGPKPLQLLPADNSSPRKVAHMKPEIRILPEQKVLFVRKKGRYDKAAEAAWSTLMKFTYSHRLMNKDTCGIGISHDNPTITPEDDIRYDACITFKGSVKPEGEVGIQTIAGGRYAVFLHKGPYKNFTKTYDYIMREWYPASKEKFRDLPCFEKYLNRDPRRTKPENLRTEIHVPIE